MNRIHLRLSIYVAVVAILSTSGCGTPSAEESGQFLETYKRAVRAAYAASPEARQFASLFPGSDHFISNNNNRRDNNNEWNSVAYIHGRYVLTMQANVAVTRDAFVFEKFLEKPRFVLNEVVQVDPLDNGQAMARFGRQIDFGIEEWGKVVSAKGDLRTVMPGLRAAEPVQGFKAWSDLYKKERVVVIGAD